jgi:hypothetical protein
MTNDCKCKLKGFNLHILQRIQDHPYYIHMFHLLPTALAFGIDFTIDYNWKQ